MVPEAILGAHVRPALMGFLSNQPTDWLSRRRRRLFSIEWVVCTLRLSGLGRWRHKHSPRLPPSLPWPTRPAVRHWPWQGCSSDSSQEKKNYAWNFTWNPPLKYIKFKIGTGRRQIFWPIIKQGGVLLFVFPLCLKNCVRPYRVMKIQR